MSSIDPTAPIDPTPISAPPVPKPAPVTLGTYGTYGLLILAGMALIGATTLAWVHDGAYTQQAFELYRDVLLVAIPGAGAVSGLHVWTQRSAPMS